MIDFKKEIASYIAKATTLKQEVLQSYIEKPKDIKNGDYAFPCFKLAKELKKSPIEIANEIKEKIEIDENVIDKIEVLNGYLNFYINNKLLTSEVLKEIKKEEYGKSQIGKDQKVILEYSSPNIAKPFHIGHLRNTVIRSGFI